LLNFGSVVVIFAIIAFNETDFLTIGGSPKPEYFFLSGRLRNALAEGALQGVAQ